MAALGLSSAGSPVIIDVWNKRACVKGAERLSSAGSRRSVGVRPSAISGPTSATQRLTVALSKIVVATPTARGDSASRTTVSSTTESHSDPSATATAGRGSSAVTGTSFSISQTIRMHRRTGSCSNTALSCRRSLVGRCSPARTCITSTAFGTTTAPRTLSCGSRRTRQDRGQRTSLSTQPKCCAATRPTALPRNDRSWKP